MTAGKKIESHEQTTIVGRHAVTVVFWEPGNAEIYSQSVNPKTGKPWQARRNIRHFFGTYASMKALIAYEREIKRLKEQNNA